MCVVVVVFHVQHFEPHTGIVIEGFGALEREKKVLPAIHLFVIFLFPFVLLYVLGENDTDFLGQNHFESWCL